MISDGNAVVLFYIERLHLGGSQTESQKNCKKGS